jgi:hypothetical protein
MVTVTDHDSIDAVEVLRKYPDFFLSEEVTVRMPTGTEMHLGVYCITEKDHTEIQRRRSDFIALLMYLTERKLFFSVNHVFSGLTGKRQMEDFNWFASYVPAFEIRNGMMWSEANRGAALLANKLGKIGVGGSDSHTLGGVGLTFTQVPGSRTVSEFFLGLRAGRGVVRGEHGSYKKLTLDISCFAAGLLKENPLAALILPFAVLMPAITAGHWFNEIRFCKKWTSPLLGETCPPRMLWEIHSAFEVA